MQESMVDQPCLETLMDRRQFLQSSLAVAGAAVALRSAAASLLRGPDGADQSGALTFPEGFVWGAATAAYQVEGGVKEGGRGESIWDRFAHTPGVVKNGATGDVACDSYHRYKDDVALLHAMNLSSYRYSIAWSRIQPNGSGPVNQPGLDYYKRLTDALLEAGIRPLVTLYHWDMPLSLADRGGWTNRDMIARFADYTRIVGEALADRVGHWAVFNEPKAATGIGYLPGHNEPLGNDPLAFLKASHVINLSQGEAFRVLKSIRPAFQVGGAYDLSPMFPGSDSEADKAAAERFHQFQNLWFLTPALIGEYPSGVLPVDRLHDLLGFQDGDDRRMRAELDYIGVNYYSRFFVHNAPEDNGVPGLHVRPVWGADHARDVTDYGWEVYPQGLYDILHRIARETGHRPMEITENGAAYNDAPDAQGRIRDTRRIAFLRGHFQALHRAISDGLPIRGYHAWSLMDNFEWTAGYTERFGLAYVDFANGQKRSIKDSGHWYAQVAKRNRIV
jgi:beta-glucosidase